MRISLAKLFVLTQLSIITCLTMKTLPINLKNNPINQIRKKQGGVEIKRTLTVGEEFTIELPANPSTGYGWFMLVDLPATERWIELIKSEYIPTQPDLIGGEGIQKLTFKAKRSTGTITKVLHLSYCKQDQRTAEIKSIPIFIKEK